MLPDAMSTHAMAFPDGLFLEIEGILVDTRVARRAALAEALASSSRALAPHELALAADDRATSDAVAAIARLPSDAAPLDATDLELAVLRAERAFDHALARGITLVPEASEAIAALGSRARLGVVTRMPANVAERVLSLAGLEPVIRCVIATPPGERVAATTYRRALQRIQPGRPLDPTSTLALVDTVAGADAAHDAGIRAIGVGRGAHDATNALGWVASATALTYDALMQLLACSGVRAP